MYYRVTGVLIQFPATAFIGPWFAPIMHTMGIIVHTMCSICCNSHNSNYFFINDQNSHHRVSDDHGRAHDGIVGAHDGTYSAHDGTIYVHKFFNSYSFLFSNFSFNSFISSNFSMTFLHSSSYYTIQKKSNLPTTRIKETNKI